MAITINVAAAKKLPHPTEQYGSIQATVSLQGEAGGLGDVATVVRDLFAAAQAGVDQHLAEQVDGAAAATQPAPARSAYSPQAGAQPRPVSRAPSTSRPAPRRGMPSASASQLTLIERLLAGDGQRASDICAEHGVRSLAELTIRQASQLIDQLKVPA